MESAVDSRNDETAAAAAAAAPLPLYPSALLSLPDLDRPPAIMEMWELEAVAAALPAKKRRLRETFDRLAACSPTPLPFRWEDLDTYISSLQYSVTLRRRQLRELEKSEPAPALAPAPAAMSSSLLPVTGGGDVGQVLVLEKAQQPAPAPVLPVVLVLPATDGNVHELRALVKSKPVQPQPPAPPAPAAAAAATGVHVEEGRKRKASIQEVEEADEATPTTHTHEGQAEMRSRKVQEEAAVKKKKKAPSPSHGSTGNARKLRPVPPGDDDNNGLAAEVDASTDAAVQVDPVSKVAVLQPELPEPATARGATNRVRAAGVVPNSTGLQRSRAPRPVPASGAAAFAAAVTGRDPEKSKKRKVPSQDAEAATQKVQTQHAVPEVERRRHESHDSVVTTKNIIPSHDGGENKASPRRPGHCSGDGLPITAVAATAQVGADPICKAGSIRQEHPATTPHASNATSQAMPPNYEAPDVEMEIVQPEEMPQVLIEDALMAAQKACQTQVIIKSKEADKVSPLPLGCSNGHAEAGAGGAATATPQVVAAGAGATMSVCKSSPTLTHDTPNLVQASAPAPKSAGGVLAAATRDASASHATRRAPAPPASCSQQDASDVSPVPPRGGNGLAQSSSRLSAGAGMQAVSARDSAAVPQGSPAAGAAPATARRDLSATNLGSASTSRRERDGPSEASVLGAPPNAGKHVLQQQHMPKHEPVSSSPKKQQEWSSKNHGGRPTGSRPVPEAQDAAAQRSWSRPGEGRGGGIATARGLHGDDNSRNNDSFEGKRPLFCDKCGCKGHLAENCRTAKHLVALYQKAKEEREKEQKQICYRCGCTGHWSRNCRTAKHLVDLYQKDRAAKRAAGLLHQQ